MLTVKTVVCQSPINGLGLFASQDISAGMVIWDFIPKFDITYNQEEFDVLPEAAKPHIRKYSYFCKQDNLWVLCGDDARFMNHADMPNTFEEPRTRTIARCDIPAGTELTCDYKQFDAESFLEEDFRPGEVSLDGAEPQALNGHRSSVMTHD